MKTLRFTSLAFVGALVVVGCKDPEPETTASTTNETSSTTASETSGMSASTTSAGSATETATATGTTGTATSDSGTGSATDTTGCSFLECQDMSGQMNECDIWLQDCPDGQKCMPWANDGGGSWNATTCSPIDAMPGQAGDECTVEGSAVSGVDSCDKGLLCWYVDENNVGSCLDMCTGSADNAMCPAGNVCDITNDGVLILCLPTCDPLLIDCPDGQICFFSAQANNFICDFDGSGEEGQYGDPCEYINVCDPGLFCADASGVPGCQASGCCSEYCDLNEPNTCAGADMGQECVPWFEEGQEPPGLEHVGACFIMG